MKTITLKSKKHGSFLVLLDDEDFERVNSIKWYVNVNRNNEVYNRSCKTIHNYLSRFILNCLDKSFDIDHKNLNKLDNRKCNLRIATRSKNCMNKALQSNSTSGYKGVSFDRKVNKYRSYIKLNGKLLHTGFFVNPIDAAIAYNKAAIKHFGEFAKINQIPV